EDFRRYARQVFVLNASTFSAERKPFTIEARSDRFLDLWSQGAAVADVFGRTARLGGPISFAYLDGAPPPAAREARGAGPARHPGPRRFLLLDASADGAGFPGVTHVARRLARNPAYELVSRSPNYFFRKR